MDKPLVPLVEEINHIKDYISLEHMRFHDTLDVSFQSEHCTETLSIAPMLFLPFVENSFKHGRLINGKLSIAIAFECNTDQIVFKIQNSHKQGDTTSKGIGLENIKKRLELLYKDHYTLTISETADRYAVSLILNLNHG